MFKSNILAAVPTNRIETKNGYAFCRYTANVSGETLVVRTWAYYDKNNNPKTGADVDFISSGNNNSYNVSINNYDGAIRDNKNMMRYFYVNDATDKSGKRKVFVCQPSNVNFTFTNLDDLSKGGNLVFGISCDNNNAKNNGCFPLDLDNSSIDRSNEEGAVINDGKQTGAGVSGGDTTKNEEKNETNKDNTQTQDDLKHYLDGVPSLQEIKDYYGKDPTSNYSNDSGDCNLIDDDLKNLLNTIFTWISIGGIILVIVMTCVSGIKVITGTEDAIKDFAKGLKVRIICLVVLLLAPVIVNFAIQTVNGVGNIAGVNQDDPLCGVGK